MVSSYNPIKSNILLNLLPYIYGYKYLCRVTKKHLVRAKTEIRLFLYTHIYVDIHPLKYLYKWMMAFTAVVLKNVRVYEA